MQEMRMYIATGTTRLAICFPKARLVVKIARIKPLFFFQELWDTVKRSYHHGKFWKRMNWFWSIETEDRPVCYTLLNGVWQNWLERQMWRKTRSVFLEPTYFTLLGLVNIQRYGLELKEVSDAALWWQICEITNEEAWSNGHHFSNPQNFSYENGQIRMTDYGGTGVWEIVEKYDKKIVREYNHSLKPPWADKNI